MHFRKEIKFCIQKSQETIDYLNIFFAILVSFVVTSNI